MGYNGREEVKDSNVDAKNPDQKGAHKWDKFVSLELFNAETATNINGFLKAWNHRIHLWLKYYV